MNYDSYDIQELIDKRDQVLCYQEYIDSMSTSLSRIKNGLDYIRDTQINNTINEFSSAFGDLPNITNQMKFKSTSIYQYHKLLVDELSKISTKISLDTEKINDALRKHDNF